MNQAKRVIIGTRGTGHAVPRGVEPLDRASLASVRELAGTVTMRLADARIDILILNAGMQTYSVEERSADGYESTFAVSNLSHYLLARVLPPRGRIYISPVKGRPRLLDPSELPRRPEAQDRLWGESAAMAGLKKSRR